ncbi:MAG: hypothetical protein WC264_00245 [Candidatus Paceibacterota bacterium]|jgi:hypothetical protein
MEETKKFLDILLNQEVQFELHSENFRLIPEIGTAGKEKLKKILKDLAWRHMKNDDHDMAYHISQIIGIRTLDIMLEVGLIDVFIRLEKEKIDSIIKAMGFSKEGLSKDIQDALIIGAGKAILDDYSFSQLKGFKHILRIPIWESQEIIDTIKKLPIGHCNPKWRSKEFPKLIRFLKNSALVEKNK